MSIVYRSRDYHGTDSFMPRTVPWSWSKSIQIIFRVIEYSQGVESRVATSEALFYCPDAVPMLVALVLFNIVHPAIALVGPDSEFPKKEKKSQKIDAGEQKESRKSSHGKDRSRPQDVEPGTDPESERSSLDDSLRPVPDRDENLGVLH